MKDILVSMDKTAFCTHEPETGTKDRVSRFLGTLKDSLYL